VVVDVVAFAVEAGVPTLDAGRFVSVVYSAVVVESTKPLKPRLKTSPSARVMPSSRKRRVVPSTTARPVVLVTT
jgi:hypothetical protein